MNTTNSENRRILIIDDNPAIHNDIRRILLPQHHDEKLEAARAELFGEISETPLLARFEIDSAYQGQEGLEKVSAALTATQPYAMAFIDVRMPPGWDGIETAARIWRVDPDLQVVICTAFSDYSWDEMIAKVGQSDRLVILKKPFDNIEVLQLVSALTEKWRLGQLNRTHIEDLEKIVNARTGELRKSAEQFRLIAENVGDLIAVIDVNGQRLYNSPSYQKILGYAPSELKNTPALAQVHSDDRPQVVAATKTSIRTGAGQVAEYRMQHKDGSWLMLESHSSAVRNARGDVETLVVVSRDITQRKKADKERQLMEMQLRQAQKLESIGQLAAGIAHEINTPIQFIGDNTCFLQEAFGDLTGLLAQHMKLFEAAKQNLVTPGLVAEVDSAITASDINYLSAEIPRAIERTREGVGRVAKIIHAMKEFSHPGTGEKTAIDLNHAIESTITVARNEWKYVAEMVTNFDSALPQVPCLAGEFNQVILNLIVNASHAIADVVGDGGNGKGTITVTTRRDGDWAEIRIADTGAGIPEKVRNRIFEPFFTTKPVGKGTGQGLTIARSLVVDKHGGTIAFETEPGKGTTFIVRLPIAPAEAGKKAA
jgi:two-component system, NtrC family, sensor kinase